MPHRTVLHAAGCTLHRPLTHSHTHGEVRVVHFHGDGRRIKLLSYLMITGIIVIIYRNSGTAVAERIAHRNLSLWTKTVSQRFTAVELGNGANASDAESVQGVACNDKQ